MVEQMDTVQLVRYIVCICQNSQSPIRDVCITLDECRYNGRSQWYQISCDFYACICFIEVYNITVYILYKLVLCFAAPHTGTRFRPLSFEVPKPLFPVAGVPMLQHHIEACSKVKMFRSHTYDEGHTDGKLCIGLI